MRVHSIVAALSQVVFTAAALNVVHTDLHTVTGLTKLGAANGDTISKA